MRSLLIALLATFTLAACDFPSFPPGNPSPTVESLVTPSAMPLTEAPPAATPSLTPSVTVALPPQLQSPTASYTPGPPTETSTPTETPGPFEHTIKQGETLGYIIQLYGYTDFSVIDEIVRMNPNIPSADRLPGAGAVILIPHPTITPTIEGAEMTLTAGGVISVQIIPTFEATMPVTVKEGVTIIGIAGECETTLEVLDKLNPDLQFFNCDLSIPSGGEGCNVPLQIDQIVYCPAPTPTPTLSPTPSGSETPTPTPTYPAPLVVFPPESGTAPPRPIRLQWVSVGVLPQDYYYLIEVEDATSGATFFDVTRETSFTLPDSLIPDDGQIHDIRWRVRVGVLTNAESNTYAYASADSAWRTFKWQSR